MPTATRMYASRRGAVALVVALIATVVAPAAAVAAPKAPAGNGGTAGTTSTTTTPKNGPAGKPTTTTLPTTTTTIDPKSVPPPPAFTLPIGLGLELLAQRDQANKDLFTYSAALPNDKAHLATVQHSWTVLQQRLTKLRAQVKETQHDLDIAHDA